MTFLGVSIRTFGDSGRQGPDCWGIESAQPVVLSSLSLDPSLSQSSALDRDAPQLPFLCSIFMRLCSLSASTFFFPFSRARSDVFRLPIVAILDVILVLVAVVAVNVILIADDKVLFPHAPALTPTAALAVVALFLSWLLDF